MPKVCTKCGIEKDIDLFSKNSKTKDGLRSECKECQSKYNKSPQGKAAFKKYNNSPKGKAALYKAIKKWQKTPKGKVCSEIYQKRWRESPEGKDWWYKYNRSYEEKLRKQAWRESPEGKAIIKAWRESPEGKFSLKISRKKYYNSPEGKSYREKYYNSPEGKSAIYNGINKYQKTPKGRMAISRTRHKRRKNGKFVENTLTADEWEQILQEQNYECLHLYPSCKGKFTKDNKPTKDHKIPLSKGGGLTRENVQALCSKCNNKKLAKADPDYIKYLSKNVRRVLSN